MFSTKPRFFIEFFHSSCVVLFLSLFLSRRAIPEASDGSLWASFVGPGLPCGLPVGRSGTTVLRFQHFLLLHLLFIFVIFYFYIMFSMFLAYLGPRSVALGPPGGPWNRGFSLSFSV